MTTPATMYRCEGVPVFFSVSARRAMSLRANRAVRDAVAGSSFFDRWGGRPNPLETRWVPDTVHKTRRGARIVRRGRQFGECRGWVLSVFASGGSVGGKPIGRHRWELKVSGADSWPGV